MRSLTLLAAALLLPCTLTSAQTSAASRTPATAAPPLRFEVAAIRLEDPNKSTDTNSPNFRSSPTTFPSNRLTMRHTSLKSLISQAYGIDYNNVLGGPGWIDHEHYDLSAKVEGDALLTQKQMNPLLQNLLEERFHLKVHREQKIVPGYALVIAKGGPKFTPNKGAPFLGMTSGEGLKFQDVPIETVANMIAIAIKQPVVDKTGIKGMYDFDLKFHPATGPYIDDPRFSSLPDIFTALQEQLGLKLVPAKVPVDSLVIDHADRIPTEN